MRRLAGLAAVTALLPGCVTYMVLGEHKRPKHYAGIAAAELATAALVGIPNGGKDCISWLCYSYPARASIWLAIAVGADIGLAGLFKWVTVDTPEERKTTLFDPEPPPSDAERLATSYEAARERCAHGDPQACARVAGYEEAHGYDRTPNALRVACDGRVGSACFSLGEYAHACDFGDGRGCAALAKAETDPARAVDFAIRGCKLDDASACEVAGFAFLEGRGVPADRAQAETYLTLACKKGRNAACGKLGELSVEGSP